MSLRLLDSDQCDACDQTVDSKTVSIEELSIMKEMSLADEEGLCGIIKRMEDSQNIHATHHIMVRLYMK